MGNERAPAPFPLTRRVHRRHRTRMFELPGVPTIAQAIQLSLSPIFMLTAIGSLLNVLTGRLARVVDRVRALEQLHPRSTGPEHDRHVWELRLLDRRIAVINRSLVLAVSSAVMTCLVVALLFVSRLIRLHVGTLIAVAFVLAMVLLIASLVGFMVEVHVSLNAVHVLKELLERERA